MTANRYNYILSSPTLFNPYNFEEKLLLMMLALKIFSLQNNSQYCFTPKAFPYFHEQGSQPLSTQSKFHLMFLMDFHIGWTLILDGLFWKPKLRKKKKFVISGSDTEFRSMWVWIFPHSYIFHWVATTRNAKWDGSLFQKCHIISSSHHPLYLHLIFLRVFTVARHSK